MTAEGTAATEYRPPRKRKVPVEKQCNREGCRRRKRPGHDYCSMMCRLIAVQMMQAQRICELVGPGTQTGELWASVVAMSDAWSRTQSLHSHLRNCALTVGISAEQWSALMDVEGSKGSGT